MPAEDSAAKSINSSHTVDSTAIKCVSDKVGRTYGMYKFQLKRTYGMYKFQLKRTYPSL